jgi:hypothetical protein
MDTIANSSVPPSTTQSQAPQVSYGLRRRSNGKMFLQLFAVLLLLGGLGAGIFLANRQQELRSRATNTNPTLAMNPATVTKQINETFSVGLTLNTNSASVSAAAIEVSYDPSKLEAQSINAGTFLPNVFAQGAIANGKVTITLGSPTEGAKRGTGVIATINFKALANGSTSLAYTANTQVAAIGQNSNALASSTGTQVTVGSATAATATPGACPTPPAPTNATAPTVSSCTSTVQNVRFSWGAASGATKYYLRIDDTSNGWVNCGTGTSNAGDYCIDNITTTNYSKGLVPGRQYKWWVSAYNACGSQSALTTQLTYTTPTTCTSTTPTPTTSGLPGIPTTTVPNGALSCVATTTRPTTFTWSAVSGADSYYLRIDDQASGWVNCGVNTTSSTPNAGDHCISGLTGTSHTISLPVNKQYKWWVSAWNSTGQGTLSEQKTFSIPPQCSSTTANTPTPTPRAPTPTVSCTLPNRPTIVSPTSALSCPATSPTSTRFTWNAVSGATKYYLRIDDLANGWVSCGSGTPNAGDHCIDNITNTYRSINLPANKQYRWWVSAFNACGQSAFTEAQPFSIPATCTNASTPTPTPGTVLNVADINGNGIVNIVDYTLYMQGWFGTTNADLEIADLNNDQRKSAIDYTIFMNGWHEYRLSH